MDESFSTYSELFERVLAKPALYVGNRSIMRIKSFMDGYRFARWDLGDEHHDDLYDEFQQFVESRFNVKTSHSWDRIICFMSSDDVDAFEMVKELWSVHKAEALSR